MLWGGSGVVGSVQGKQAQSPEFKSHNELVTFL